MTCGSPPVPASILLILEAMYVDFDEVREVDNQVPRLSHSVTFNQDGSFTCWRRYDPLSTPEQFLNDIEHLLIAARQGKIDLLENKIEGEWPFFVSHFFATFRPLR